jgi:DNA-binding MarR family transcriptional regulator
VVASSSPTARKGRQAGRTDQLELWRSTIDAWKRLQRGAEKNLLAADLSPAELRILKVLKAEGSTPMNRFCPATMLSQPAITGVVDKMEERGLVERVRNARDRREVLIAVTPKGSDALARGEDLHREFVKRSLSVLTRAEMAELSLLLRKVSDKIAEAHGSGD